MKNFFIIFLDTPEEISFQPILPKVIIKKVSEIQTSAEIQKSLDFRWISDTQKRISDIV